RASSAIGGLPPGDIRLTCHLLRTSSRCHRRRVCGLTRNDDQRARGSVLLIAAMNKRSPRRRRGLPIWRLRTINWCRRTTTSTSAPISLLEEPGLKRITPRTRRYTRAKSKDRTSQEKEADPTKCPG